jgi:methionine-rich copper-binding protein CopC
MTFCRNSLSGMVLAWIILGTAPAHADTELVFSLPVAESTIPTSPQEIVLTFNGTVKPVRIKVADKDGKAVAGVSIAEPEAQTFHIPISRTLSDGKFSAGYEVIADTGKVMAGAFDFSVQTSPPKKPIAKARPRR